MVLDLKHSQFSLKPIINIALLMLLLGGAFTASGQTGRSDCRLGTLPSVQFASGSRKLSKTGMASLDAVSENLKQNPGCKVKVTGFGTGDKRSQQLSWDHVNAVIRYLVERQGISNDRFIFSYGEDGPATSVDMVATTEDGPTMAPAPHPTYSSVPIRRN